MNLAEARVHAARNTTTHPPTHPGFWPWLVVTIGQKMVHSPVPPFATPYFGFYHPFPSSLLSLSSTQASPRASRLIHNSSPRCIDCAHLTHRPKMYNVPIKVVPKLNRPCLRESVRKGVTPPLPFTEIFPSKKFIIIQTTIHPIFFFNIFVQQNSKSLPTWGYLI